MTVDDFKRDNPLGPWLEAKGVELKRGTTNRCPIQDHKPSHLCVTVNVVKEVWHCNDHGQGGDLIRWMALEQGKSDADVIKAACGNGNGNGHVDPPKSVIVDTYSYFDETGKLAYEVCRFEPKTFRQRHKGPNDEWIWSMEGVRRILYNLPAVLNPKNRFVWVVEGEKDVRTLMEIGLCGTTNVGGAKKWCVSYSECLKGKEVILCGDNDEPGRAHMKMVLESLAGKANSIRQVVIPDPHKDVTDFVSTFSTMESAQNALGALAESAPVLTGGIELPILSMEELEREYENHLRLAKTRVLNLSNWLPSLGRKCRGLVPGEVVSILAATGVGKTALLQNLAMHSRPLLTLLFEMELPGSLTFERFCAMSLEVQCQQVENTYSSGTKHDWRKAGNINHIWTCTRSKLTPDIIETLINKAELKMGARPALVLIDYIQLIGGKGMKRYELVSDAAEDLKRIAKTTETIIVIASQIKRKEGDKDIEVTLHDAKESGAIENSSGLVLGVWRPQPDTLFMKILKNTKGFSQRSGEHIACNFDGPTMTITEKSPIDDEDVPRLPYGE
jgi:5S rRNA maturation endonuclease (ribonuclease M5)